MAIQIYDDATGGSIVSRATDCIHWLPALVAQFLEEALPQCLKCRAFDLTTAGDRVDAAPGVRADHEMHNLHLSGLAVHFDLGAHPARHPKQGGLVFLLYQKGRDSPPLSGSRPRDRRFHVERKTKERQY